MLTKLLDVCSPGQRIGGDGRKVVLHRHPPSAGRLLPSQQCDLPLLKRNGWLLWVVIKGWLLWVVIMGGY